jgi:hypothetical protein
MRKKLAGLYDTQFFGLVKGAPGAALSVDVAVLCNAFTGS